MGLGVNCGAIGRTCDDDFFAAITVQVGKGRDFITRIQDPVSDPPAVLHHYDIRQAAAISQDSRPQFVEVAISDCTAKRASTPIDQPPFTLL